MIALGLINAGHFSDCFFQLRQITGLAIKGLARFQQFTGCQVNRFLGCRLKIRRELRQIGHRGVQFLVGRCLTQQLLSLIKTDFEGLPATGICVQVAQRGQIGLGTLKDQCQLAEVVLHAA